MLVKNKYSIKDTVYFIYQNEIVCAQVYAIRIDAISFYKKQLHHDGSKKMKFKYSYQVVCEETRCNKGMEEYFYENELYESEEECIKNIRRVK